MGTLTQNLWAEFGSLRLEDFPDDVKAVARHSILDWFGCALAGAVEPVGVLLRDELSDQTGAASVIGSELRLSPRSAALINGACGHALDFDDTASFGHPTAPILPAALSVAETEGRSGADLLCALVVGHEIASRIGVAMGPEHYHRGWHTTATIGVFGATAAVAHLMRLDAQAFGRAIGIAASQSAGVKANFGTMVKPLHAGLAAERGLISARLAARGFTANSEALEGNQGLLQAAGSDQSYLANVGGLKGTWRILETLFKYHAACYLTHSTIEGVSKLASELDYRDIDRIQLKVNPAILDVCGLYDKPETGLEAKFSLKATAAMAAFGIDTSRQENFDQEIVCQHELRALMERVHIQTDQAKSMTQAEVEITDHKGSSQICVEDSGIPSADLKAQGDKLIPKFLVLTEPALGERNQILADRIWSIADVANPSELFFNTSNAG